MWACCSWFGVGGKCSREVYRLYKPIVLTWEVAWETEKDGDKEKVGRSRMRAGVESGLILPRPLPLPSSGCKGVCL